MSKHTATEWVKAGNLIYDRKAPSKAIAKVCVQSDQDYEDNIGDRIITACNAHEELVAALEACVEYFEGVTEREMEPSSEAYQQARAALAKTKGQE